MSVNGLRGTILTQLARRGGHRSSRRIKPEEEDGYLQAIRGGMLEDEVLKKKNPTGKETDEGKKVWGPKL